ncbi:hypothetical protein [Defluviimonas sp. SAOS-178_SWC]|uniref:hypothetical protein n=1 Tax=Defluviimonas sp. SAOS-178_SWC TaxID=3121287 RepID=UPI003221ADBA
MADQETRNAQLNQSGQNLVRIVIASYFLAVSLGLIPGTVAWPLTAPFLPEPYADLAGKAVIFTTAYLVLVGAWLRVSALLLATVLFWSSYIQNISSNNLEGFWRDLALIGALILTYTQTLPRANSRRSALHWRPRARKIAPAPVVAPRRVVNVPRQPRDESARPQSARPGFTTHHAARPKPARGMSVQPHLNLVVNDNIFREHPDLALAS